MKLYQLAVSPFAARVRIALYSKGITLRVRRSARGPRLRRLPQNHPARKGSISGLRRLCRNRGVRCHQRVLGRTVSRSSVAARWCPPCFTLRNTRPSIWERTMCWTTALSSKAISRASTQTRTSRGRLLADRGCASSRYGTVNLARNLPAIGFLFRQSETWFPVTHISIESIVSHRKLLAGSDNGDGAGNNIRTPLTCPHVV